MKSSGSIGFIHNEACDDDEEILVNLKDDALFSLKAEDGKIAGRVFETEKVNKHGAFILHPRFEHQQ